MSSRYNILSLVVGATAILLVLKLDLFHHSGSTANTRVLKTTSEMSPSQHESHFKTLQKFKADFCPSDFTLYESKRTGMRVVVVNQKGPKVYGLFALATEIHDDSGAPHTLEHLVFMGSRSYKYKGLLDRLANRAYSTTNAWTDVDNTAYMLDTAGWQSFALMLPVYLEHVLLPTLTDAGCYTEVYHVDGTGHDAGVVYSEMQGTQNTQSDLMDLKARRLLYPKGSGFRAETGGLMEALRVLTAERIRSFHREMYQPKNLCLVLAGEVDHSNLLDILDRFESSISGQVPRLDEPFQRPWIEHGKTKRLEKSVVEVVEFPEEDESVGEILIGFLGPDYFNKLESVALKVLVRYLSGSSVALLDHTIVEVEQLASSVEVSCDIRPDMAIWFSLTGVESDMLEAVEQRFFDVLEQGAATPFDMDYMQNCISRYKREIKSQSENSLSYFSDEIIRDHLFGSRDGSSLKTIGTLKEYDMLETWDDATWRNFFSKWIAKAPHISVLGKPSQALATKLEEAEKARVRKQQEKLGEDGLKELERKLAEAKAENDREIPKAVLKQFDIPGADSIHFIPTVTARSGFARKMGSLHNPIQRRIDQDKTDYPLFIHFEHVPSNFMHIAVSMNTHSVSPELLPLLPIFILNFFDTPINRNGQRLEFEDVIKEFETDVVEYTFSSASVYGNSDLLRTRFIVEPENYELAIQWMKDFIFNSIFDPVRLKATLAKLLADVPDEKRDGFSMTVSVASILHMSRNSPVRAQNPLVKALYLRRTLQILKETPEEIVGKLEKLRKSLADPASFRIYVAGDLESGKVQNPVSAWKEFTKGKDLSNVKLDPLDAPKDSLSEAGRNPGSLAYIVPMPTVDSSFALFTAKGPDSYNHPQLPALVVATSYLEAVEGPLWIAVRGTGLAYGVNFAKSIETGAFQYSIYRSPDPYKAFTASRKTVADFASGKEELNELAFEGAISSIVYEFASEQDSMFTAAIASFRNQVIKAMPKDWDSIFMKKVRAVTMEEVRNVMKDVILPVFKPGTSDVVITCAPIMQDKIEQGLRDEGFKPETKPLAFFQDSYDLEGAEAAAAADDLESDEHGDEASEEGSEHTE